MVFDDDHTQSTDWMAFDIATTFKDFVAGVSNDLSVCHHPGQVSLSILDCFLSDALDLPQGDASDSFVDAYELIRQEMSLQEMSIAALAGSPTAEAIGRVRAASVGRSILGAMWYPV